MILGETFGRDGGVGGDRFRENFGQISDRFRGDRFRRDRISGGQISEFGQYVAPDFGQNVGQDFGLNVGQAFWQNVG